MISISRRKDSSFSADGAEGLAALTTPLCRMGSGPTTFSATCRQRTHHSSSGLRHHQDMYLPTLPAAHFLEGNFDNRTCSLNLLADICSGGYTNQRSVHHTLVLSAITLASHTSPKDPCPMRAPTCPVVQEPQNAKPSHDCSVIANDLTGQEVII